jgi:hypothetical protein
MIIHVLNIYRHDGQYDSEPYLTCVYYFRDWKNMHAEQQRLLEKDKSFSFTISTIGTQD